MVLYDFLAPAYDPALQSIYHPFRTRAIELLPALDGASVLDLACGTGQNFPLLAGRIGRRGKIIGLDLSTGMLRRAQRRLLRKAPSPAGLPGVSLVHMDAGRLSTAAFEAQTGLSSVDFVVCAYGFTAMRGWKAAFWSSFGLLKPGGGYLIHDIDGQKRNLHTFAVEMATRCDFSQKVWQPLQSACPDFRMDYIEPSAHLFGGRLFVAYAHETRDHDAVLLMSLLINKEGKQLGPYSLDEARALVLAGKLDADDWAWAEGATDWVSLKEIPGYALMKPAPPAVAPSAATAPSSSEEELWRGHPSQILNSSIYFFWGAVLIVTLFIVVSIVLDDSTFWSAVIFGLVALIALINSAVAYLHLHTIEYVVTNQRVRIISGIFSKDIQEIELFRVKDTMVQQSFFLRLFGLGTITILSGDENHPRLVLSGLPRAVELREKLRQEVMTLRQRFGVREVDVM